MAAATNAVLVVDDDEPLASLIEDLLASAGFHALVSHRGDDALEAVGVQPISAAILDVDLPGISGYELCHALRDAHGAELPIVFISGERTESFDRVGGLLVGADDYLVKPFAPDELLVRLRSLVARRGERPEDLLTQRELEVLKGLAEGYEQEELADLLVISHRTVGTHIEHILAKLEVHSRAQAVAYAYRASIVR